MLLHWIFFIVVIIGIELPTNHNITEGVDPTVEYCVVISVPGTTVTIQHSDFSVCVSTVNGTAMGENTDCITHLIWSISPHREVWSFTFNSSVLTLNQCSHYTVLDFVSPADQDYQAVTNMHLGPFGNDDRRQCFAVNIINDAEPEDLEDFMVIVQFCPGEAQPERVNIDPQTGITTIINDDSESQVMLDYCTVPIYTLPTTLCIMESQPGYTSLAVSLHAAVIKK